MFKIIKTQTLYQILGVETTSTQDQIKKAYRKLIIKVHPNKVVENKKSQATVKFKEIAGAYEVLSDQEKRKTYDNIYGDIEKAIEFVNRALDVLKLFKNNNKNKQEYIKRGNEFIIKLKSLLNISNFNKSKEEYKKYMINIKLYINDLVKNQKNKKNN